jgi:hypothetical protein
MPAPTTTTTGYYNPNKWPVLIDSSTLSLKLTIPPGKFLTTADGARFNDPRLDRFVQPGQLARETGQVLVPLVLINPAPKAEQNAHGFHGKMRPNTPEPKPKLPPYVPPAPAAPAIIPPRPVAAAKPLRQAVESADPVDQASRPSHVGMTTAEARRLGLLPANNPPPLVEGKDDDGSPGGGAATAPKMSAPKFDRVATLPNAAALTTLRAESATAQAIAATPDLEDEAAVSALLAGAEPALPEPAVVEEAAESAAPDEAAPAGETPAQAAVRNRKGKAKTFVCKSDGKAFVYRSELLRHVQKHYPAHVEVLMADYPAT